MRLFRKTTLRGFARELAPREILPLALAIFSLFAVLGPVMDVASGGRQNIWLLVVSTLFSGTLALGYGIGSMRGSWPLLGSAIAAQLLWVATARLVWPTLPQNPPGAAAARLSQDAGLVLLLMLSSYSCFLWFINGSTARYLRVRAEMDLAHDIHRVLVPAVAATRGGFEFFGLSAPSGEVGGDLIDVVDTPEGWFGYVADVSGHGVSSGVVMGMFKSALRMGLRRDTSISALLADLNTVLIPLTSSAMFVTVACMRERDGLMEYAVAGHVPILRVRAGVVEEITTPQIPIGMFEDYAFTSATLDAAPGDLLVLITDGLIEVFDAADRELGLDAVKQLLAERHAEPLRAISDAIFAMARAHGTQIDDQTLLLIRR